MAAPVSSSVQTLTASLWDKAFSGLNENLKSSLRQTSTNKRDILEAVQRIAENKRDASIQKRWKFKSPNGEVIILRDVLEKITKWITRFKSATVNDIQQYGAMVVDIEVISRLIIRYKKFERLYLASNTVVPSHLDDALTSLYTEVLTYLARTIDVLSERTFVRMAKAPFRLGDEEQMQRILKQEEEVYKLARLEDTEKMLSMEISILRLAEEASNSSDIRDEARHVEMVRWLSTSPYSAHHETITETRAPKFGQWLLQNGEYKDWCQSSSSSVFLLVGIPGSGKTHLCSAVIDELLNTAVSQASSAPFAYFYCLNTDSEPERSSAGEVLRSVLRQLAITDTSTRPRVRCLLESEFEKQSKSARLSGLDLPRLKTKHCVDLITKLVNDDPVTIVLDAIDEIHDDTRFRLIDALNRIMKDAANLVKIFLTTRTDGEILSSFPAAKTVVTTSTNVRRDMEEFILGELDNARLMDGCISSEVRAELADALLNGAGEMFLWAQLQIQQLRRRKIARQEDLLPALKTNILADLDQLYETTLGQALSGGDTARSFVIRIFSWLLYMKSPLALSALVAAVTFSDADSSAVQPTRVSDMCAHLVVVDARRDAVRFAHQSIEEFLRKKDLFSPCLSHSILASTCIDVCLHGPPVGQPLEVQTIGIHEYAAMYWAMHFQDAEVPNEETHLFQHMLSFIFDDDDMAPSLAFRIWMDIAEQLAKLLPNHHPMKPTLGALANAQESPIFLAAMFGMNGLLDLLATSAIQTDWNQRNEMGHTAVYLAATYGNASTVLTLIKQGAEANVECGMRGSPLHVACFRGHKDVVKELLNNNASSTCGNKFKNALDASAHGDHEYVAIMLIQAGTIKTAGDYEHAVHTAFKFGFIGLLSELQKADFNSFRRNNVVDREIRRTENAIKGGQLPVLQRYLSSVADPSKLLAANAVATAASRGHNDIIEYLLGIGMSIEAKGELGTPLRSACIMGQSSTVQLLLSRGVEVNSASLEDDILHAAAVKGHAAIVRILISEGADVNQKGGEFGSALQASAYKGHNVIVEILIDAGADVHAKGCFKDALHASAEGGHEQTVLLFLNRGYKFRYGCRVIVELEFVPSRPNRSDLYKFVEWDKGFFPPLVDSAAAGRVLPVRLLLGQTGRHLEIEEDAIMEAMESAASHGHVEVLETILESMTQRGLLEQYLFLLLRMAGRSRISNTIRFALSTASQNGISPEEIDQMRSEWPPGPEKYAVCVIDKDSLQRDFMGVCTSGDEIGLSSILETNYRALLGHEDFAKGIEHAAEAGHVPLLVVLLDQLHLLFPHEPIILDNLCITAAKKSRIDVLELLLSRREDPRGNESFLGQLAYVACKGGHPDVIKYLTEELNMDVNMQLIDWEDTVSQVNADCLFLLKDSLVGQKRSSEQPRTSLLRVALRAFKERAGRYHEESPRSEVVTHLLAHGADPSYLGGQDTSPIHFAVKFCPDTVVRQLIGAGADVTCVHVGESALQTAMGRTSDSAGIVRTILGAGWPFPVGLEEAQLLIERFLNDFVKPKLGAGPPLSRVDIFNEGPGATLKLLDLLLRHYSNQKTEDVKYAPVLEKACRLGMQEFVELLLSRGTNPDGWEPYHGHPLHTAARNGYHGIARLLLEHGARVDTIRGRWHTALGAAIIGGHGDVVQLLLSHGADINLKFKREFVDFDDTKKKSASALQLAVARGDIGIVNALLKAGADVHEDDTYLSHPLILACRRGCVNIATVLLEAGAPVNISGKPARYSSGIPAGNASPLHASIARGNLQLIELLLKHGADASKEVENSTAGTALMMALRKKDECKIPQPLDAGPEINHEISGRTALLEAVGKAEGRPVVKRYFQVIELLLDNLYHNCDQPEAIVDKALIALTSQDQPDDATLRLFLEYLTPTQQRFSEICSSGSVSIVISMLDAGMSVNGEGNEHDPVYVAARCLREGVVRVLLGRGADIRSRDPNRPAPLLRALLTCAEPLLEELAPSSEIQSSLRIDRTRRIWRRRRMPTLRSIRALHRCKTIVQLLVNNGADPNAGDSVFGKPLHVACLLGSTEMVTSLVGGGAEINASANDYYETPLFAAMYGKHLHMVSLLLEYGADVTYMHQLHGTPLHFACAINNGEITRELLQHGASVMVANETGRTSFQVALDSFLDSDEIIDLGKDDTSLSVIIQEAPQSVQLSEDIILKATRRAIDSGTLARLLEADRDMLVSQDLISRVLEVVNDVPEDSLKVLLERCSDLAITERFLMAAPHYDQMKKLPDHLAMCKVRAEDSRGGYSGQQDQRSLELLLDTEEIIDITEGDVLKALNCSRYHTPWRASERVLPNIWRRKPSLDVTREMLQTAATPEDLKFLLGKLNPANGSLQDLATAIAGRRRQHLDPAAKMLFLLFQYDTGVKLNSDTVTKVIHFADDFPLLDEILTHGHDLDITEKLFLKCFRGHEGSVKSDFEFARILHKHGKKLIFTQKIRDAIDRAYEGDSATHIKQLFYTLRERDETAEEAKARLPEKEEIGTTRRNEGKFEMTEAPISRDSLSEWDRCVIREVVDTWNDLSEDWQIVEEDSDSYA